MGYGPSNGGATVPEHTERVEVLTNRCCGSAPGGRVNKLRHVRWAPLNSR